MRKLGKYAKWLQKGLFAVAGAVGALAVAVSQPSPGHESITAPEWYGIVIAGLAAAGVIASKNGPKPE